MLPHYSTCNRDAVVAKLFSIGLAAASGSADAFFISLLRRRKQTARLTMNSSAGLENQP